MKPSKYHGEPALPSDCHLDECETMCRVLEGGFVRGVSLNHSEVGDVITFIGSRDVFHLGLVEVDVFAGDEEIEVPDAG